MIEAALVNRQRTVGHWGRGDYRRLGRPLTGEKGIKSCKREVSLRSSHILILAKCGKLLLPISVNFRPIH